ncbi:MAG: hypothetical protein A2X08_10290 [Bacteroidetes bacterium GWA2_32_17]|nr:MAG: hypothetical protein A2X08_10290 [Bacteroidetes bacterium GWA2_32_17]
MNKKNQIKIFIVEDNNVFALALKADLETSFVNMPIQIHLFETGEKCMEKLKQEKPQIVILDYHLNSKNSDAADGVKVLDWIKKENNETYVIMLTRDDNIDIALQSLKHGANDYVVKTDTQFRKIIFSLFNFFKIMNAKSELKRYKYILIATFLCVSLLVCGVLAIWFFASALLR